MNKNEKVDGFINRTKNFKEEVETLRSILLDLDLTEELKWGVPCYTFEKKNIVLVHVFKEYCALLFFKGALLNDEKGILITQTENTQASRQIRFKSIHEIEEMKDTLKEYVDEAIQVEKAGLKVQYKKTEEFSMPEEFEVRLKEHPELKIAFQALTPGRQRAYLLHFAAPKQSKTRESRIDKCVVKILDGKGLND